MKTFIDIINENIYKGVEDKVRKLYNSAVTEGKLKVGKDMYYFSFLRNEGVYIVTDEEGEVINRYNTRKISVAKKWLKEFLAN